MIDFVFDGESKFIDGVRDDGGFLNDVELFEVCDGESGMSCAVCGDGLIEEELRIERVVVLCFEKGLILLVDIEGESGFIVIEI